MFGFIFHSEHFSILHIFIFFFIKLYCFLLLLLLLLLHLEIIQLPLLLSHYLNILICSTRSWRCWFPPVSHNLHYKSKNTNLTSKYKSFKHYSFCSKNVISKSESCLIYLHEYFFYIKLSRTMELRWTGKNWYNVYIYWSAFLDSLIR